MAKASLEPIYERLHGASGYHPFNAQTFADWSIEAGDTVTIKRGNDSYNSPIHVSRMVWKGTPQVSLEATGHRNRDPIARMSLKKYGRSGSGLRNSREMYLFAHDMYDEDGLLHASIYATVESFHMAYENLESSLRGEIVVTAASLTSAFEDTANSLRGQIIQTASSLTSAYEDTANSLHSEIVQTASMLSSTITDTANSLRSQITQTAASLTSAFSDEANSIRSEIVQTASSLSSVITDTASSLRSSIQQNANRIGLVVDGNGIKAAQIVAAVNNAGSSVLLSASHVVISGTTTINDVMTISENRLQINSPTRIVGNVTAESLTLRYGADNDTLTQADLAGVIKSASVSGNELTLVPVHGNPITFSKATSLTGAWGSGTDAGKYIVTASPQGTQLKFDPPMRLNGPGSTNDFSAEITETVGSTTYARKSIYGYIVLKGSGANASARVNTKNDGSGTDVAVLSVGSLYTSGQNVTAITGPTWTNTPSSGITGNSNTATFTTDAPTPKTKSLALYLVRSDSWVNNVRYVYITHTNSEDTNRVARIDVDASSIYTNGRNATKVSGPTWNTAPASNITGNSNTATFTTDAPSPVSGAAKSLALYLSRSDSWSNNVRYVYVSHTDSSAANRVARIDVDASSIYTNGRNVTAINDPTWTTTPSSNITGNSNTATFSTDAPTPKTKSLALYLSRSDSWSNNVRYVYVSHTNSNAANRIARIDVDASSLVSSATTAGKNSAKVTGPTWSTTPASTVTGNSNTATFTTDADSPVSGAAKSLALYLNQGSWSSNKKYVYITHTNSTDANRIARIEVDASSLVSNATTSGKNSAKVTGPTWSTTPSSSITGNSNTATFTTDADSPVSGAAKSLSLYMSQGDWSSNKKYVYVTHTNSTDANRIARVQVDASTLVTNATNAGKAAVTLNDPTWNSVTTVGASRTVTVSTTGRTNSSGTTENLSKSVTLYLTQGSWSSNKLTVSMRTGSTSGTVYASTQVDAGTLVTNATNAGKAAVTLQDPTWNSISGSTPANRTVTVSTTGRTNSSGTTENLSKSVALYLTQSSSFNSSHEKTVYMRTGSTSGTVYAQTTVDASGEYSAGQLNTRNSVQDTVVTLSGGISYSNNKYMQSGTATVRFTNGQSDVTGKDCWGGVDVTGAYSAGWSGARNQCAIPTSQDLNAESMTCSWPSSSVGGSAVSHTYALNVTNSYAQLKYGSTVICQKAHTLYADGQKNTRDSVSTVPVTLSGNVVYDSSSHKYMQSGTATVTFSNGQTDVTGVDCWGGVDVTGAYSAGWGGARNSCTIPTSQDLNAESMTCGWPNSTVGGTAVTHTYALNITNSYAQLKYGNTVICQKAHTLYADGQSNSRSSISNVTIELSGQIAYNSQNGKYYQSGTATVNFSNGQSARTGLDCYGGVDVSDAHANGYAVSTGQISISGLQNASGSTSISGRTSAGGISRPSSQSYIFFTVTVHGTSKNYYISVN